jgi:hypothetical protein
MEGLWLALEQSAFGGLVRNSTYLYPAANIIHVVAVLGFFGLVATMDLRLLRAFGGLQADRFIARLRPFAAAALILIAATGFVLLTAEASAISANPAFRIKALAIVLALLNVWLCSRALRRQGEDSSLVRLSAGFSLAAWLFVAAMGRTIAYV